MLNKSGPILGIGPGPIYIIGPGPMCHMGLAYNRQVCGLDLGAGRDLGRVGPCPGPPLGPVVGLWEPSPPQSPKRL